MVSSVRILNAVVLLAIAVAVIAAMALSLSPENAWPSWLLKSMAGFAVVIFAAEFFWRYGGPVGRMRLLSAFALIEFAVWFLPLLGLLSLVDPLFEGIALLCALLKLARFVPALGLVMTVMRNEARALLGGFLALGVLLILAAGLMYAAEHDSQPEVFSSIPKAMWWAIVTMASVGYGDMVPVTAFGRVLAGFIMLMGIAMFAVPAGILATGFAGEMKRRDFIVTWEAVRRVPLFADLEASRIAAIAHLLKPQVIPQNQVIVQRGEPADAMFFILKGSVSVEVAPQPMRLGAGQFFGEIGLILETTRTATVIAAEECQLLALNVADFKRLIDQLPDLKARIAKVAEERLAQQKR